MFELRQEHEKALAAAALDNFEDRAVAHVRKNLAPQTAGIADQELRARIHRESERSRAYGLKSERQIMRFVDSNFLLGENYLAEPAHQWARELLESKTNADERAYRLLDGAAKRAPRSV